MTDPVRISPSQIATWNTCPRRWWYSRNRPRGPEHPAAAFGTRTHAQLEEWLLHGKPPDPDTDEGRRALPGLAYLPLPRTAAVEVQFEMPEGAALYNGRIDFLFGYDPGRCIVVGDHKTTGDFRYAKTEEDLLDDPQRIVYSRWAAKTWGVDEVIATWVYYRRRGAPKAMTITLSEPSTRTEERFQALHERVGLPIVQGRSEPIPDSFPRNLSSCHLYPPNGCPFKNECHMGTEPADLLAAALENVE